MYRQMLFLLMCVIMEPYSTSTKARVKWCSSGCDIANRVLTCTRLSTDDLHKLSRCIKKHHGPLVIDIRKQHMLCSCKFLEFAKRLQTRSASLMFYDTSCTSEIIVNCGASKGVAHIEGRGEPFYALIGGVVLDTTHPKFEATLKKLDARQTDVILALPKRSLVNRYRIAEEDVIEGAVVNAISRAKSAKENELKQDTTDTSKDNYNHTEDRSKNVQYTPVQKMIFIFIVSDVCLVILIVVVMTLSSQVHTINIQMNKVDIENPVQ